MHADSIITRDGQQIASRLLKITSPTPDAAPKVIGILPEAGQNAPVVKLARDVAAAAEGFSVRVADVARSLAGPSQRAGLKREEVAKLAPALKSAAVEISTAKASVDERIRALTFTPAYGSGRVPGHQPFFDLEVAKAFAAQPATERTMQLAMLKRAPFDLSLIDALQRVPPIVSGVSRRDLQELRVASVKTFMRTDVATLEAEIAQIELAEAAVRASVDIVNEATGTLADLRTLAPEAMAVHADSTRLQWLPPADEG